MLHVEQTWLETPHPGELLCKRVNRKLKGSFNANPHGHQDSTSRLAEGQRIQSTSRILIPHNQELDVC